MIRNMKIYFSFFIAALKKMLSYRVDCLVGIISQIAFQVIELIFIWIIFQNTDNIAGWTFEHLLLFYGVMMLSVSVLDLFFDSTYEVGRTLIRKGKFDTILLRPVHPLVSILGDTNGYSTLGYVIISVFLIVSMLIRLQASITVWLVLKILYFGIMGGIIMGGIQTIFSVSGLWTYKSNELVWSAFQLHKLAEYPLEIYNNFIRFLITIIFPFAFASYYPTLNYLGMSNIAYLAPLVAIIVWFIAVKIWNWALSKYRSTGS